MKKLFASIITAGLIGALTVSPANAAVNATLSKSTDIAMAGETLSITLSGIPAGQGVYVRLCKNSDPSVRPSLCQGGGMGGAWASLDSTSLMQGAVSAANPVNLAVSGQFTASGTSVDCSIDSCVVFIRRDHLGSGDQSLDTRIPVTFSTTSAPAAAVVVSPTVDQTISAFWAPKKYNKKVARKSTRVIAKSAMITTQGNQLTWASATPSTCTVKNVKRYIRVQFLKKGSCEFTATAAGNNTYKPTVFTWKYSVR